MKKKIFSDLILNMFATFIPVFALQFIILPCIALKTDAESYGQLITIIAFVNLSASTMGSVLNNSRLINFTLYDELKISGDFNILLALFVCANTIFMIIGLVFYGHGLNIFLNTTLVIVSVLLLLKSYASVEFRIKLNYKYILLESLFLFLGYIIGLIVFLISGLWQFIYLCGFAFSFLFIIKKTKILKDSFKQTTLFKRTTTQTLFLLGSGILVSLGTYIDKLILYPLLGGNMVSVYYTATILGKTVALVIVPITSVMLSYIAHMEKFSNKYFSILLKTSFFVGALGYLLLVILSKPLLTILYPQFVQAALKYIYITTLSVIITFISNIINSVLLKFCNVKWQIYINGLYMSVYIVLSLVFLKQFGLMGFCIGILIAELLRLIIILYTYYMNNMYNNKLSINSQ